MAAVGALAASVASFIVILWAAWLRRDYPDFISVPNLLINCVSVAVAFIPEGMPIAVTCSLTLIAGAMKKKSELHEIRTGGSGELNLATANEFVC